VPTFVHRRVSRGQRSGSLTVVNLSFLDRSRHFSFKQPLIYPHKGWVDTVSETLLLRKTGSAENRTWDLWVRSQELWPLVHRGGLSFWSSYIKIQDWYIDSNTLTTLSSQTCSICMFSLKWHILPQTQGRKNGVFWDVTPCGSCKNRRFGGT
jgi:hypothetical protein